MNSVIHRQEKIGETGYGSGKWGMDNVWHGLGRSIPDSFLQGINKLDQ